MKIKSAQIVYSEHEYDECFEYNNGKGRVPDGIAIGYLHNFERPDIQGLEEDKLILFSDIKYSEYDHKYWDNHELENDIERVVVG